MKNKKEKCGNCKKNKIDHQPNTMRCPTGTKYRVFGYISFKDTVFKLKKD